MSADLRECPCCGQRRAEITARVGGVTSCVRCPACGFQTIGAGPGTEWCVKSWNATRHYDAALAASERVRKEAEEALVSAIDGMESLSEYSLAHRAGCDWREAFCTCGLTGAVDIFRAALARARSQRSPTENGG